MVIPAEQDAVLHIKHGVFLGDRNGFQRRAVAERIVSHADHARRDFDFLQVGQGKGVGTDMRDRSRNDCVLQAVPIVIESFIADRCDRVTVQGFRNHQAQLLADVCQNLGRSVLKKAVAETFGFQGGFFRAFLRRRGNHQAQPEAQYRDQE